MYQAIEAAVAGAAAALFAWGAFLLAAPGLSFARKRLASASRHAALLRKQRLHRAGYAADRGEAGGGLGGELWRKPRRSLELMLRTLQGDRYRPGAAERWVVGAASIAAIVFALGVSLTGDIPFAAGMGALMLLAAFAWLQLRFRRLQIQAGYDLAEAVGVLAGKYKMTRGNMRLALRHAAQEISSAPIRRMFLHIVREEMNYLEPDEMEKAVEDLVFGIQTSFAKQLGLTLLKGLLRGENVERTLMAIDKNIHRQMDVLRDESDSSGEVLQLSWLHLILFPLLIVFMVAFMGWNSTVHYQLGTESGRFWLGATVVSIGGALLLAVWFRRPPNDY